MTRVPLLTLLLSACASGTLAAPDDGTETAAPTDVGTASPCGEGAPEGCERVGNTCAVPYLPPGEATDRDFTDEDIRIRMLWGPTCGYFGATTCDDPRFFAVTTVLGDVGVESGLLVQEENGAVGIDVWDVLTRELVATGSVLPRHDGRCTHWWYGDPQAFGCMGAAYERALLTMPSSCTVDVTCDYCACRVNEVTDATSPDCVQP